MNRRNVNVASIMRRRSIELSYESLYFEIPDLLYASISVIENDRYLASRV